MDITPSDLLDVAMKTRVAFIMGPGHCGSTLLDLLLGSHSQAFSLGELYRIHGAIDRVDGHEPVICGVCGPYCEFWNERVPLSLLKLYFSRANMLYKAGGRLGRHVYNPYQWLAHYTDGDLLIDSSKRVNWIARQLKAMHGWSGIEPYLIYMWRDGRGVVNSYQRKYPDKSTSRLANRWRKQVLEMDRFYEAFPSARRLFVQYEHLASRPTAQLQAICRRLGLGFEPDMLRYWVHDHHHIYGNGGTRALIYRFWEQFGGLSPDVRKKAEWSKQYYASEDYEQVDLAIQLDERWREEMPASAQAEFQRIGGDINQAIPERYCAALDG